MDFWTPEQITKFIGIEQAFEEFRETDPELSKLDSTRPDPKGDSKVFKEWYARYYPAYDAATERFVELFRKKILVALALRDDKLIVLPPEYWASPLASLTFTKGKVQGLSHDDPDRHLENSRVVLRREDWEKWINGAAPGSQHGPQEPAETPVPEGPEDEPAPPRKKPAELMHKRWIERAKELKGLNPGILTSAIASKLRREDLDFNKPNIESNDPDEIRMIRDTETIRRVLTDRQKEWNLPPES